MLSSGILLARNVSELCIHRITTEPIAVSWLVYVRIKQDVCSLNALRDHDSPTIVTFTFVVKVFDVTRKQTYINLKEWYKDFIEHCGDSMPCVLVANKVDVNHLVTKKSYNFATQHNLPFFFVSCSDNTNVEKVFTEAICAGLGHKKFGDSSFLNQCLDFIESCSK